MYRHIHRGEEESVQAFTMGISTSACAEAFTKADMNLQRPFRNLPRLVVYCNCGYDCDCNCFCFCYGCGCGCGCACTHPSFTPCFFWNSSLNSSRICVRL